ncbi:hypothetical protein [Hymenobacter cellulosilyticus]|uniref:Uncharacterized protein n=1 Tax=Hymenobacter cellulosilyticus TaxID=2932248 RepID=A0A8T9QAU7_9BACT|nr:hypothetical protein [Hymenobacter cellulosilyticus]UOQ74295.1 hypothetical protein MUN79_10670 [Hymenobacter cellulosilyticus]
MPTRLFLLLLLFTTRCDSTTPVQLRVTNDSQLRQVGIRVECDGQLVLDTLVSKYRSSADQLRRELRLRPGPHRIVAQARGQRTRLDTLISTAETNVLGLTFRFDSLAPRSQKTYFADGAEGEITFPAFYQPRSFRLFQFQARDLQRP